MHADHSTARHHRARWAAIGAAVAVSLGAGGFGIVKATSPEGASAYVPISPCRLLDTRADSQIGQHAAALGPDNEITLDGWGAQGNCTLPSNTTGLELNVTAVDASTLTNLRFYPEGVDTPTASNLNPAPGEPPTPNSVSVTLNAANGQFHVFNRFGNVHIVIDVVGVYSDHQHDGDDIIDESLTGADIDDGSLTDADILDEAGLSFREVDEFNDVPAVGSPAEIATTPINAPASGYVTVEASAQVHFPDAGLDNLLCTITNGAVTIDGFYTLQDNDDDDDLQTLTIHRTFAVDPGRTEFKLVCGMFGGSADLEKIRITATYVPSWRGDLVLLPPVITLPIVTLAELPPEQP